MANESIVQTMASTDTMSDSYRVKLDKVNGRIGFAYRADVQGLIITGIIQDSPVEMWNHTADADRIICVGDCITAVNSASIEEDGTTIQESNCEALVKTLVSSDALSITIKKFGPRWHVEGVTADCIDKINIALDQGMELELVQPDSIALLQDDVIKESDLKRLSRNQFLLVFLVVAIPNALLIALWSDMGIGFTLFGVFAPARMNLMGNGLICMAVFVMVGMYLVDWHKWESRVQQVATAIIVVYAVCLGGIIKCRFYPQAPMVITLFHLPVFIGLLRATALKQVHRGSFYRGIGVSTLTTGLTILLFWMVWMFLPAWDGSNTYNEDTKNKLVEQSEALYAEAKFTVNGRSRAIDYFWDCKDKKDNDFDVEYGELVGNDYILDADEKKARVQLCGQAKTTWFLLWISPFICVVCNLVVAAFCAINGTMMDLDDTTKAEKALKQFILMVAVLLLCMWVAASIAGASMRLTGTLMAFCGAGLVALFIWMYFEVGAKLIHATLRTSKIMSTLIAVVTNDWFRACVFVGFNVTIPAMFAIEVVRQKVRRLRKTTTSTSWLTPEATSALEFLRNWQWAGIFVKANWLSILYWTLSIGVAKITVVFLSWLNEEFQKNFPFVSVLIIFFWIGFTMFMLPPVPGIPVYITSGIIIAAQARDIDSVGFWGGILTAIALSFILKLTAVCGQYSIGFFMGKSVKIQQLVGVDKVPIRSVERILMKKGLSLGKVAVLVGGPDWPTSVLCGILKLNLLQCVWGTVPVIFVSSPCVIAGAFLAGPDPTMPDSEKSMWDALANTALAGSALGQLASGVLAMYYIQDVVNKHGDDLAKPRPEHEKVKQLTLSEQDYQNCYAEILQWQRLPRFWFGMIFVSVATMLLSMFIFTFMDEACFRTFQVKDSISDPDGLDCSGSFGCALYRIIKDDPPLGWGALFLFVVACVLHFVFLQYAKRQAKKLLQHKQATGELSGSTST